MDTQLYLAPMAGVTDQIFRSLCFEYGCDFATTEMVSAQGYITAPKDSHAYVFLLAHKENEGALAVQLFGSEPAYFSEAAKRLTDLGVFYAIDINMGCPAQKVVGGQAGSALMKDPPLAAKIVTAVKASTVLPVTVKMRIGWDDAHINAVDFAKTVEDAGADLITVHGRTRMQQYAGKANWQVIRQVREAVHIPVAANGDVTDGETALACLKETGCDRLAVGRGALGKPWLFREIRCAVQGQPYTPPTYEEVVRSALRQGRELAEWKGEKSAVLEMRKHFSWYIAGRRGAARVRTRINQAQTFAEVEELLLSLGEPPADTGL